MAPGVSLCWLPQSLCQEKSSGCAGSLLLWSQSSAGQAVGWSQGVFLGFSGYGQVSSVTLVLRELWQMGCWPAE